MSMEDKKFDFIIKKEDTGQFRIFLIGNLRAGHVRQIHDGGLVAHVGQEQVEKV